MVDRDVMPVGHKGHKEATTVTKALFVVTFVSRTIGTLCSLPTGHRPAEALATARRQVCDQFLN